MSTPEITVVCEDITLQRVDAVVNAASNAMRGGGGVDGAIHRAGGPAILTDCIERFPRGLATGDAGWTTAGDLPARWVIHTVGPNFSVGERDRSQLVACYRRAIDVADEVGAATVAFPLISAGVFAWPLDDAIEAAVVTLSTTRTNMREARIAVVSDQTAAKVQDRIEYWASRSPDQIVCNGLEVLQSGYAVDWPPSRTDPTTGAMPTHPEYDTRVYEALVAAHRSLAGPDSDYLENMRALRSEPIGKAPVENLPIEHATLAELSTMLTAVFRGERFSDGTIASCINNGDLARMFERVLELT